MWTRPVYIINTGLQARDEADAAEENEDEDEDAAVIQHPAEFDLWVRSYRKLKQQYSSTFEQDLLTKKATIENLVRCRLLLVLVATVD